MTKERPEYGSKTLDEVLALRYVLNRADPGDRLAAAEKLNAAALNLRAWTDAVFRALKAGDAVTWEQAGAILQRAAFKKELAEVEACKVDLTAGAFDPEPDRAAFDRVLTFTREAAQLRRLDDAARCIEAAKGEKDPEQRREKILAAACELTRQDTDPEQPLADAWQTHLESHAAPIAEDNKVLRLNTEKRGTWAAWFNDNLGSRAGIEPGETVILGGAPEAGKTSFSALLAVDALAAGCPVLCWQLELSREDMLEHLQAQLPEPAAWYNIKYWNRARRPMPEAWADLLTVPRWPSSDAESIEAALIQHAAKAERARRSGIVRHAVNGLVIVDYAQLLTMKSARAKDAGHEVLTTAASHLSKAAAERGAVLVILSQLNKKEQNDGITAGTALHGADLARMAHRVAMLHKACIDNGTEKPCGAGDEVTFEHGKGEARLVAFTKRRGMKYTEEGHRPDGRRLLWYNTEARAFHSGENKSESWEME